MEAAPILLITACERSPCLPFCGCGSSRPHRRSFMKSKIMISAVRTLSLLLLVSGSCALAGERRAAHFGGLINDFSPLSTSVKGSPWEMHGQWSMDLFPEWETADFSADMTMSGYGTTTSGAVDPAHPLVNPHTHHIRLTNVR